MKTVSTQYLTRAAMLLALVVVFQNLRIIPFFSDANPMSVFIIGSLVNMTLILACEFTGFGAAFGISILSAVIALMQGHIKLPILMPIVAIGNTVLVVAYYYLMKRNRYIAVIVGATLKWSFLFLATSQLLGLFVKIDPKILSKVVATFNLPQIITALIGGFLAIIIANYIGKSKAIRDDSSVG